MALCCLENRKERGTAYQKEKQCPCHSWGNIVSGSWVNKEKTYTSAFSYLALPSLLIILCWWHLKGYFLKRLPASQATRCEGRGVVSAGQGAGSEGAACTSCRASPQPQLFNRTEDTHKPSGLGRGWQRAGARRDPWGCRVYLSSHRALPRCPARSLLPTCAHLAARGGGGAGARAGTRPCAGGESHLPRHFPVWFLAGSRNNRHVVWVQALKYLQT